MRFVLAIILVSAALFAGCNGTKTKTNTNTNTNANANRGMTLPEVEPLKPQSAVNQSFKSCNPYYPLVPGSQIKYRISFSSGLFADANIVVDSVEEGGRQTFVETTQIVDTGGGLEKLEKTVRKYICENERIQIVYEKGNNRAGELANEFGSKFKNVPVVIVEPAGLNRKGTTWSYSFYQFFQVPGQQVIEPPDPVTVNFEVLGEEEVTTPAGEFKSVKISRTVKDKKGTDFFAKGIGLVKRIGPDGTTMELREYSGVKVLD